jgi:hypothetical protein
LEGVYREGKGIVFCCSSALDPTWHRLQSCGHNLWRLRTVLRDLVDSGNWLADSAVFFYVMFGAASASWRLSSSLIEPVMFAYQRLKPFRLQSRRYDFCTLDTFLDWSGQS